MKFRQVLRHGFRRIVGEEVALKTLVSAPLKEVLGPFDEFSPEVNRAVQIKKHGVDVREGGVHGAALEHQGLEHEPW